MDNLQTIIAISVADNPKTDPRLEPSIPFMIGAVLFGTLIIYSALNPRGYLNKIFKSPENSAGYTEPAPQYKKTR